AATLVSACRASRSVLAEPWRRYLLPVARSSTRICQRQLVIRPSRALPPRDACARAGLNPQSAAVPHPLPSKARRTRRPPTWARADALGDIRHAPLGDRRDFSAPLAFASSTRGRWAAQC